MEKTIACTRCDQLVSSLVDQVLDLPAFTVCQCRCGEIAVVVKPLDTSSSERPPRRPP